MKVLTTELISLTSNEEQKIIQLAKCNCGLLFISDASTARGAYRHSKVFVFNINGYGNGGSVVNISGHNDDDYSVYVHSTDTISIYVKKTAGYSPNLKLNCSILLMNQHPMKNE